MSQANSTNRYAVSNFIVAPTFSEGSTHTTIASALASASSGDSIFLKPGIYSEDITAKAGVNIVSFTSNGVAKATISGKITASYNGACLFKGINLQTNSDNAISISGSNTSSLIFENCNISGTNATALSVNAANFSVIFETCIFTTASNNLNFAITTVAGIDFRNCTLSSGTAANTIAAGAINFFNCRTQDFSLTTSATGTFNFFNSYCDNSSANQLIFTTAGTNSNKILNCELFSGSASSMTIGSGTTVTVSNSSVTSSNTNTITGVGTLSYSCITMMGSSNLTNTTTQTGNYCDLGKFKARSQPAFLAYLATTATNKTGNATIYTLGTDALTEVFDQGGDFTTAGVFTAPVTGRYYLQCNIRTNSTTNATSSGLNMITSNRTYRQSRSTSNQTGQFNSIDALADMDAADTCTYTIVLNGIGADTAGVVGSATLDTYVSGELLA